jgi:pimeloyl-ACP methyl ester carboxylesterase
MIGRSLRPLVESGYSLWMVARRRGMPHGHTIEDMATDYADLIASELAGSVNLVVGISYGGAIGQYLAANHPDRFDHIALVGCAYTFAERGLSLDYDFATALSHGHRAKAGRLMARAMLSDSRLRWTSPVLGTLMGLIPSLSHDHFGSDVMVEADAEMALDSRPVLSRIPVPVLLVGGDKDFYLPVPLIEETARLIPDCTLKMYQGKGHAGAIMSRRLATDILDFINREPPAAAT